MKLKNFSDIDLSSYKLSLFTIKLHIDISNMRYMLYYIKHIPTKDH